MLLFLSITGIILSTIILLFNGRNFRSALYLGAFFLLVSYYSFLQYVMVISKSVLLVSILYLHFSFLAYLIGPMLYWYVRSVLSDNSRLKKSDLWHLLPALVFLISIIPYIFTPFSEKMDIATRLVEDISNLKTVSISSLYDFLPGAWIYMSRPILILAYTLWSVGMVIRYVWKRKASSVFTRQRYVIKWLSILLGFLFLLVTSHLILMIRVKVLDDFDTFSTLSFLTVISGIGLVGLLISPFFFPGILYGLPQIADLKEEKKEHVSTDIQHYESDYIKNIQQKVSRCMEEDQPYLQADCNLAFLSKLLDLPVHHLAYYFREERKQYFNDFRNEYRVKHAKNLIRRGKAKEMTLEAIGLLSGFSNRKTFIASFKKVEGVTPGIFLSQFDNQGIQS